MRSISPGIAHINWNYVHAERRPHGRNGGKLPDSDGNDGVANDRSPRHARRDLLEQLQPFAADAIFEREKAGDVAARSRQSVDEAGADRIGNYREHDRHGARGLL
jgi:hypothetical protein